MATTFQDERYSRVARWLHWIIAALILLNLAIGLLHDPLGEMFEGTMPVHKSIGLTVLALTIVRVGWRITHPAPPLPASIAGWQRTAAHVSHFTLYAFMLSMPVSGWIMSSAGKYPLSWFWLFDVPKFAVTREDAIVALSRDGHGLMGWLLLALAALHIAAALRHQFVLKDGVLRRMLA